MYGAARCRAEPHLRKDMPFVDGGKNRVRLPVFLLPLLQRMKVHSFVPFNLKRLGVEILRLLLRV